MSSRYVSFSSSKSLFHLPSLTPSKHRDLHENNVCIAQSESGPPTLRRTDSKTPLRFGFSNFEVTLIDYGLSRAKLADNTVVYLDLEQDLSLFHGDDGKQQFDTYRRYVHLPALLPIPLINILCSFNRMRCHLYNNSRSLHPKSWHDKHSQRVIQAGGKNWSEFKPYNNVLWIKYLLKWLTDAHKIHGGDRNEIVLFKKETRELNKRLDTRTKVENGAFESAQAVMAYIAEMGWVSEEQIERYGVDSTMMSQ